MNADIFLKKKNSKINSNSKLQPENILEEEKNVDYMSTAS